MLKRIILALLLIPSLCFAQGEGFIEVQVEDFVTVKPKTISYEVVIKQPKIEPPKNFDHYSQRFDYDKEAKKYFQAKQKELKSKLASKGFKLLDDDELGYGTNQNYSYHNQRYVVQMKNQQELNRLVTLLKSLDFVRGNIHRVNYKKTTELEEALMTKLMKKATEKAQRIARLAKKQLGEVLWVSETKQKDDKEYRYRYVPRESIYRDTESSRKNVNGKFVKTIVVRFAAN